MPYCIGVFGRVLGHAIKPLVLNRIPPTSEALTKAIEALGKSNYVSDDIRIIQALSATNWIAGCTRCGHQVIKEP